MAVGERFRAETAKSIASVKRSMSGLPVAVATDVETWDQENEPDHLIQVDAKTRTIGNRDWLIDSTIPPGLSPFNKTLFLDSDTYLVEPAPELFDILDHCELAMAPVPNYYHADTDCYDEDIPACIKRYNCGVMAYRDTESVQELFRRWGRKHQDDIDSGIVRNQPAFLRAFVDTDLLFHELPPNYNFRYPQKGSVSGPVKLLHGRHWKFDHADIAEEINASDNYRLYHERLPYFGGLFSIRDHGSYAYYVDAVARQLGIGGLVKCSTFRLLDLLDGGDRVEEVLYEHGI